MRYDTNIQYDIECNDCRSYIRQIDGLEEQIKGYRLREQLHEKLLTKIAEHLALGDAVTARKLAIGECPF